MRVNIREISLPSFLPLYCCFPFLFPLPPVESSYQFPSKMEQAIFHAITPTSVDFPNESLGKNWQTGWNAKPSPPPCGLSVFREGGQVSRASIHGVKFSSPNLLRTYGGEEREGKKGIRITTLDPWRHVHQYCIGIWELSSLPRISWNYGDI